MDSSDSSSTSDSSDSSESHAEFETNLTWSIIFYILCQDYSFWYSLNDTSK